MDKSTLAYIAGFLDGEGCISLSSNGTNRSVRVTFVQCDIRPLEKIQSLLGGAGQLTVFNSRRASKKKWKTHRYKVSGPGAVYLLEELLPYLIVKKEQAEIVIKYQKTLNQKTHRLPQRLLQYRQSLIRNLPLAKKKHYVPVR